MCVCVCVCLCLSVCVFLFVCRFSEWPSDALKSVASRFLHDVDMGSDDTRAAVEDMCMVFHQTVGC